MSMPLRLSNHFKGGTFPYVKEEEMATNVAAFLGQSLCKDRMETRSRRMENTKPKDNMSKEGGEGIRVWTAEASIVKLLEK